MGTINTEYAEKAHAAFDLLKKIESHLETHGLQFQMKSTDWGYVGDLGHIVELLERAEKQIRPNFQEIDRMLQDASH